MPERIGTDYKIENASKKDYQGREILELIQNADDEMSKLDIEKRIISISYKDGFLSVSNNGDPFDEEGVKSLMLAHHSDKEERSKKTPVIGNKGTGFRAVLSWASKVVVHSGELHIAFSSEYSNQVLHQLPKSLIEGYTAATLAFPKWIGNDNKDRQFDTEIGLYVLDDDSVRASINKQLTGLSGEILLFLNYATSISIEIDEYKRTFRKITKNNKIQIEEYSNETLTNSVEWITESIKGGYNQSDYFITVAYRTDGNLPEKQVLYSYLPTDVALPLPILLHASLELDGTRNRPIKENKAHKEIMARAAELIAQSAENRAQSTKPSSFDALKMLVPSSDTTNSELNHFSFWDHLFEERKKKRILPTVNDEYISVNDYPIIYSEPIALYLRGDSFKKLIKYTDEKDLRVFLLPLKESRIYPVSTFSQAINKWSKNREYSLQTIIENCALIKALNDEGENAKFDEVNLIYASDKKLSTSSTNPIYISVETENVAPPDFVRMKLIDPDMENRLLEMFGVSPDVLAEELSRFNLRSFDTGEVIEKMQTSIKRRIEHKEIESAKQCITKSLMWMSSHYEEVIKCDLHSDVLLLNRGGNIKPASTLYLGREYGEAIVDDLLKGFDDDVFVAYFPEIAGKCDFSIIKKILIKLGVESKPRDAFIVKEQGYKINQQYAGYIDYFWEKLPYPIRFEKYELKEESKYKFLHGKIHTLEHLQWILENSDTGSIIRWIKSDSNLRTILKTGIDKDSEINVIFDNLRDPRKLNREKTPSMITWLFNLFPWITVNGKRYTISDCVLETVPAEIADIIVEPDIASYISTEKGSRKKLRNEYESLLSDVGVCSSYGELQDAKMFAFLSRLADVDDGAKIAKTVYKKIYDDCDEEKITKDELDRFVANGKMLCQDGQFYTPSECFYLERRAFCKVIRDHYHLVDIRTRLGPPRILKLFGVKKLDVHGEIVGNPKLHPVNDLFQIDFEHFKICAYCYRYGNNKSKEQDELSKFKDLKVVICEHINCRIDDEIVEFVDYDYISSDEKTYYLCLPTSIATSNELRCHDVGEAVASIICEMLKLSEEKMSFRDLYMKNHPDRVRAVKDEAEDPEIYETVSNELNMQENNKSEFVSILLSLSPDSERIINEYASLIDFDHFNSIANATFIIECLNKCNTDIPDYNSLCKILSIDLNEYYIKLNKSFMAQFETAYQVKLFHQLNTASVEDKLSFVDKCIEYKKLINDEKNPVPTEDSVHFSPREAVISYFSLEPFIGSNEDLTKLFNDNKITFEKTVTKSDLLESFYSDNEITSLLYFGEFDELSRRYQTYVKQHEEPVPEPKEAPHENYSLSIVNATTTPRSSSTQERSTTVGFSKTSSKRAENAKNYNGRRGEEIVFYWLKKHYEKVEWVSENAKNAGENPLGSASNGFDMYYFEGEKQIFVEVKSTSSDTDRIFFYMSSNELDCAIKNEGSYKLFYVTNVNSSNPKLYILSDVIKDGQINPEAFAVESNTEYKISGSIESVGQIED